MKIQCTCCGGIDVTCEARINSNTNEFIDFTEDSFVNGHCDKCGEVYLTDVELVKKTVQEKFDEFVLVEKREPDFLQCEIIYTDEGKKPAFVNIKINQEIDKETDDDFIFNCDNLHELLTYCEPCKEFFIITVACSFGHSEILKHYKKRIP